MFNKAASGWLNTNSNAHEENMAITAGIQESEDNVKTLYINIAGRLDISSYGEFNIYKDKLEECSKVVLDMSELEYLDSSALGMLLMLRERAGATAAKINIINCSAAVFKILSTVKFDIMFNISECTPEN